MESDAAAEHLQVIRTLMERSTLYRRAMAPMMLLAGGIGTLAAGAGWGFRIGSAAPFVGYWVGVGLLTLTGALLLVRRQAVKEGEPFWSSPTRRVVLAALPAGVSGLVLGGVTLAATWTGSRGGEAWDGLVLVNLPLAWAMAYGCAIHAAGFFTTRGVRLFGWLQVGLASVLLGLAHIGGDHGLALVAIPSLAVWGHGAMGLCFGLLHLAYGGYLYVTERKPAL